MTDSRGCFPHLDQAAWGARQGLLGRFLALLISLALLSLAMSLVVVFFVAGAILLLVFLLRQWWLGRSWRMSFRPFRYRTRREREAPKAAAETEVEAVDSDLEHFRGSLDEWFSRGPRRGR